MDPRTLDDLKARLKTRGFTPGARDVAGLLAIAKAASPEDAFTASAAIAAIAEIQGPIVNRVRRGIDDLPGGLWGELMDALRKRKDRSDDDAFALLCASALGMAETRTRRSAARALGETPGPSSEEALRAALEGASHRDDRAAIVRALAKLGAAVQESDRSLLEGDTRAARHSVIAARDKHRGEKREPTSFVLPADARIVWLVRSGLESILREELEDRLSGAIGDLRTEVGRVSGVVRGSSGALAEPRCALAWGLHLGDAQDVIGAVHLVDAPASRALAAAMGLPRPRFRVETADARGRSRAIESRMAWTLAEAFRADRGDGAINDPTRPEVVVRVEETKTGFRAMLLPSFVDERFSYRTTDVPAASHPTIAAALARVSKPEHDDVVWDPFVGSGLELCERALLHPYAELIGTDLDPSALAKARRNLAPVAARATLVACDARSFDRREVSAIITNPPLGRRVGSQSSVPALLEEACSNMLRCASSRGRVALVSPRPELTRRALSRGMVQRAEHRVDMGGFDGYLQMFEREHRAPRRTQP